MYLQTPDGKSNPPLSKKTKFLGIDDRGCNYYMLNGYFLVELPMNPAWYLINSSAKVDMFIKYLETSTSEREKGLLENVKYFRKKMKSDGNINQQFGIPKEIAQQNTLTSSSYKSFIKLTLDLVDDKELVLNTVNEILEITSSLSNELKKYNKTKKGYEFIMKHDEILKNKCNGKEKVETLISASFTYVEKIIEKVPICCQSMMYWKKLYAITQNEIMKLHSYPNLKLLRTFLDYMIDTKKTKYRLDESSYEEISSSSDYEQDEEEEISEEGDDSDYSFSNIITDEVEAVDEDNDENTNMSEDNENNDSDNDDESSKEEEDHKDVKHRVVERNGNKRNIVKRNIGKHKDEKRKNHERTSQPGQRRYSVIEIDDEDNRINVDSDKETEDSSSTSDDVQVNDHISIDDDLDLSSE